MVAIKTIFAAAAVFVGATQAAVIPEVARDVALDARAKVGPADPNSGKGPKLTPRPVTCRNTGGNFRIDLNNAESAIHQAPAKEYKQGSGYPHINGNREKFAFANSKCSAAGVTLLEFPVFADGHFYQYTKAPKPDTGDARAIYVQGSKDFCGVIAHTEKPTAANGNSKGPFALCT